MLKILFITSRFPYPPVKGDKIVPYQRLKKFSRNHEITLLSLADTRVEPQHIDAILQYCKELHVIPLRKLELLTNLFLGGLSSMPLQVLYYRSRRFNTKLEELLRRTRYDLVHAFMLRIAPYVSDYQGCPKIIELIDAMELNMNRRASLENNYKKWVFKEETRRLAKYEKAMVRKFDVGVVVSDVDGRQIGVDNVVVSPLGVDDQVFYHKTHIKKETNLIIFTGNMGYFPNEMAVLYFSKDIFPLIQEKIPDAKFWVVGGGASPKVRQLENMNKSIRILGYVDSMADNINLASVSVCPMLAGSGMQFKILEALACGVPVVATSVAKGDIKIADNEGLVIADEPAVFAEKVVRTIRDTNFRNEIARKAPEIIGERYSWQRSNMVIEQVYAKLLNGNKTKPL